MSHTAPHRAAPHRAAARPAVLLCVFVLAVLAAGCGAARERAAEHPGIAAGRTLYDVGRYEQAETHFRDLLLEAERSGDLLLTAQCGKWIGNILRIYTKYDDAQRWYLRSLAVLDSGLVGPIPVRSRDTALRERDNIRNNLTTVLAEQGSYAEAEALLLEVLAADRARGEPLPLAVSLTNLAILRDAWSEVLRARGEAPPSRLDGDSVRALFHASLVVEATADAWMGLGKSHAGSDDLDSAVACFARAEEMYQRAGFRIHRATCLGNIGVLEVQRADTTRAIEALRAGIAIFEELRGNLASIDVRSSFIASKYHLYESLIALLVAQGRTAEAFEYVERAKARSFLDMIGNKSVGSEKLRSARAQVLVEEERALQDRMSRLLEMPDSTTALARVVARHRAVLDSLQALDPEYASVKSVDPLPLDVVQQLLDDSTALLEYYLGEAGSYVFVIRPDTAVARALKVGDVAALGAEIETLRRDMYVTFPNEKVRVLREARLRDGKSAAEATAIWRATVTDASWQTRLITLYSRLVQPVERELAGVRRLYIVPHGPLHHLPFGALVRVQDRDPDRTRHIVRPRYLIERMDLAYLPSASVLWFARLRASADPDDALIVGDPVYADPVYRRKPLANALIEADSVARFVSRPLVLTRAAAEEAVVKRELATRGLVHLATHGELNKKDPLKSRILLAAATRSGTNDGDLTVEEVFNLDLRAALVTLSACQTAQVGTAAGGAAGDDMVGLTRSFLYAGTPAVIATLWYVDDAATLAWMNDFYRDWLARRSMRVEAAGAAARRMLAAPADPDWIHPFYWGAFIYFGSME
jgi:CHAT domain-containing protein/tetratricopeptide (TPR) repeat protein